MDAPTSDLPGEPRDWREFRVALKHLIARAELTALAIEKLSNDPAFRAMGAQSIADSTIGRKLADKDEAVDARSVRTIVTACRVATERRGRPLAEADVETWLAARTRLMEGPPPAAPADPSAADPPGVTVSRPGGRSAVVVTAVAVLLIMLAGGGLAWRAAAPQGPVAAAPSSAAAAAAPGHCDKPPDRPVTAGLTVATPAAGTSLKGDSTEARGTVTLRPGERPPWLLLFAQGECRFYLEQPVVVSGTDWSSVIYADPNQTGAYAVYIVAVNAADDDRLHQLAADGGSPSVDRLPPSARFVNISVRCCG